MESPATTPMRQGRDPYLSLPIPYSAPAALGAVAALFGRPAPAAETARVLELGCASGGNIIPLAARFPRASFVGLDLSDAAIAKGRARIAALGLENIEMQAGDIASFAAKSTFDYVICHGVYSWTPPPVRAAILRIAADSLSETGLAAISFNVLPGWRVQQIVRDICLGAANLDAPPTERTARARAMLAKIAETSAPALPYGLALRQAAQRLAKRPDSYLLGEFLARENDAFTFDDFTAAAARVGLSYLCDGEIQYSTPHFLHRASANAIRELAGDDPIATQRLLDLFSGRTFRRAVLSKHASARLDPDANALSALHIGLNAQASPPHENAVIEKLAAHYPSTMPVSALIAASDVSHGQAVLHEILAIAGAGRAHLSTLPISAGRAGVERPVAHPLARLEAAQAQRWVTSLLHRAVAPSRDALLLLPHLDGSLDRAQLAALLEPKETSSDRLDVALLELEREALLVS